MVELTSRVSTDKVAEARRRLGCPFHDRKQRVDCAIATNMISVGLDIQRLGLMLVYGQPKTHSEYIQATSRVGRDDRRPGLVVTLYNVHKPRDRSHYERFRHYHETFYRSVEVSSVTPFAARALDRGFAGALVALARHARPAMTPPAGVEAIDAERAALERLLQEVFGARIDEQPFDAAERAERHRSLRNRIGDLAEQVVRCECGKSRRMHEAVDYGNFPLGACRGARPWLGRHANEECREPSRLLIRTASNAWFPQVVSVLSLPDRGSEVEQAVEELWDRLQIVADANALAVMKQFPDVANRLAPFSDAEVLDAIAARKSGGASGDRPIKHAELDALLSVPEGYGEDVPVHPDFHARRLPEPVWRRSGTLDAVEAVTQVHRLREVLALAGFTRLEPVMPNVDGEYEAEVERADIALEPSWFPAVENRGEGILLRLRAAAVAAWLGREAVKERLGELISGHNAWAGQRGSERPFPGGAYVLLHTLSHLLIQSLSMRCGYSAASIRERIFVDVPDERYALLLYTASPDAEGTLGGLVQEARRIEAHLQHALRAAALCSNDPVCADHVPGRSMEERWLHGAACHGCTLIAETSCEMRNEYLDRALVVPTLYAAGAAFFGAP